MEASGERVLVTPVNKVELTFSLKFKRPFKMMSSSALIQSLFKVVLVNIFFCPFYLIYYNILFLYYFSEFGEI